MTTGRPATKNRTELGKRLYRARVEHGLSQQELANQVGVNQQAIAYWERSAKTFRSDMLIKLCKALDLSADELLGLKSKRRRGPTGKVHNLFKKVSSLPRSQQKHVLAVVEAYVEKKTVF